MSAQTCKHCEQSIPPQRKDDFCCDGCKAAYHLIQDMGLSTYYDKRILTDDLPPPIPEDYTIEHLESYLQHTPQGDELALMVDGLHCAACVWVIEHILQRQTGIISARLNMTTKRLRLVWNPEETNAQTLLKTVNQLGYKLRPYNPKILQADTAKESKSLLLSMGVAGFAAANVMLLSVGLWAGGEQMTTATQLLLQWFSALIVLPTTAWAGRPFFKSAFQALRHKRLNMDVPISLAIILTVSVSFYALYIQQGETYFESASMLLFFLLVARYLDAAAKEKNRACVEQLMTLTSTVATRQDPKTKELALVPIEHLTVGDTLIVAVGERIPADGVVLEGSSTIDTQIVTGESLPRDVSIGHPVQSGTLNLTAPLIIQITAVGDNATLAKITHLVEQATERKNAYTRIADKISRAYAPLVHTLAGITLISWLLAGADFHHAILIAVSVLIVTCPCALALAVPAVQVATLSRLMKRGIILQDPALLEKLPHVSAIVFDKTGTLTQGILSYIPSPSLTQEHGQMLAALAGHSRHPLSKSIAAAFPNSTFNATQIEEKLGHGITGTINGQILKIGRKEYCDASDLPDTPLAANQTDVWCKIGKQNLFPLIFEDQLREDAQRTVQLWQDLGKRVILLSGDREDVVEHVAKQLNIAEWHANCTPEEKYAFLYKLDSAGWSMLMVGDGINDAPALAIAHTSMTLGDASDIAQSSADGILQRDKLTDTVYTYKTSQKARSTMQNNFLVSFAYNAFAIPLAMAGFITPLWAAVFMSTSSLTVVLNALRLSR